MSDLVITVINAVFVLLMVVALVDAMSLSPCPRWLHRWIDRRGRIPRWVRWIWPLAHWCPEMDGLLVVDSEDVVRNCHCGCRGESNR